MKFDVIKKELDFLPVNFKEVVRYTGEKSPDDALLSLISDCVSEYGRETDGGALVCYSVLPLKTCESVADFSAFSLNSHDLVKALKDSDRAIVFACTVGLGIDRCINRYADINPSRALVFQSLGAERVETFIDGFLDDYKTTNGVSLSARFSAGYGDLSLSAQKVIFDFLKPETKIGLTLNDSLIMSPSKSVTAIVGIKKRPCETDNGACINCGKTDCDFRKG